MLNLPPSGYRIGELLCEFRHGFNVKDSLMLSDIKLEVDSVSIWLRSEKVASDLGNVVEIWSLPEREDLDPVVALKSFLQRRSSLSSNIDAPVFTLEDGSNLTKTKFNEELKKLLGEFPELTESPLDSWTGHSFRSGLPTILQSLGFSEDEIKSWGRWKSAAYLSYLKDMTLRKKTRARLTTTFSQILKEL